MTDYLDEIRKQVDECVAQEASASQAPPDDQPDITRKDINDCLLANEYGDGTMFAMINRGRFVFVNNSQEWNEWAGNYWQRDIMCRSLAAVEGVVHHYLDEYRRIGQDIIEIVANSGEDDNSMQRIKKLKEKQDALLARARQLRGDKRRSACLKFAHTIENPLSISGEEFDTKPMLFPCRNGVIDLETGRIKPGRQSDYLSRASKEVGFLSIDEPAPLWEKSLLEIFGGNEEMVAYLQRLFGVPRCFMWVAQI